MAKNILEVKWNTLQEPGLESKTRKIQCQNYKPLSTPWWPSFPPCTPPCRPTHPPPSQWQSAPTQWTNIHCRRHDHSSNIPASLAPPCQPPWVTSWLTLGISIPAYHSTNILMTTFNSNLSYWHHQLVLGWYHHQPESHQQSLNQSSCMYRDREP